MKQVHKQGFTWDITQPLLLNVIVPKSIQVIVNTYYMEELQNLHKSENKYNKNNKDKRKNTNIKNKYSCEQNRLTFSQKTRSH